MSSVQSNTSSNIPFEVFADAEAASAALARVMCERINANAATGKQTVLGLATGSTPIKLYQNLIRLCKNGAVSFKDVTTFNLDEYLGLAGDHPRSYRRFMDENFFDHIDIDKARTHVPSGLVSKEEAAAQCAEYEEQILRAGGLHMQVLGIGRNGHIGFNEPGSRADSRTRLLELNGITRADAANDFGGLENVPTHAITMGIATILQAKEIFLLAWGKGKSEIIAKALSTAPTSDIPATFLRSHPNVRAYIDEAAASVLQAPVRP